MLYIIPNVQDSRPGSDPWIPDGARWLRLRIAVCKKHALDAPHQLSIVIGRVCKVEEGSILLDGTTIRANVIQVAILIFQGYSCSKMKSTLWSIGRYHSSSGWIHLQLPAAIVFLVSFIDWRTISGVIAKSWPRSNFHFSGHPRMVSTPRRMLLNLFCVEAPRLGCHWILLLVALGTWISPLFLLIICIVNLGNSRQKHYDNLQYFGFDTHFSVFWSSVGGLHKLLLLLDRLKRWKRFLLYATKCSFFVRILIPSYLFLNALILASFWLLEISFWYRSRFWITD